MTDGYYNNGTNPTECNSKLYRKWYNDKWLCMTPFYGGSFEQEIHESDYYPTGNYKFGSAPFHVNGKSYLFQVVNADNHTIIDGMINWLLIYTNCYTRNNSFIRKIFLTTKCLVQLVCLLHDLIR